MFSKWKGNIKKLSFSNLIVTSYNRASLEALLEEVAKDAERMKGRIYKIEIEKEWETSEWFCRVEHI